MEPLNYINQASVGAGVVVFVFMWMLNLLKDRQNKLEDLLRKALAASAIPPGLVLIFCAHKPELITKLREPNIYIAVAGLALIYISIKGIVSDS
jgi:hypothetical protein